MLMEGSLTNLAVISYIGAALMLGMYVIGRDSTIGRIGMWAVALAFIFNSAAWGVRWIEYVDHFKALPGMTVEWPKMGIQDKINNTFPLSNLYDITLGFTSWMGFATLLITRKKKYDFLGAFTAPVAALLLTLAIFLGNQITVLQPILR